MNASIPFGGFLKAIREYFNEEKYQRAPLARTIDIEESVSDARSYGFAPRGEYSNQQKSPRVRSRKTVDNTSFYWNRMPKRTQVTTIELIDQTELPQRTARKPHTKRSNNYCFFAKR